MTIRPLATPADPRRTAVLVVDVQPLFVETAEPSADEALLALTRFLFAAHEANVLRVFIRFMQADTPTDRWASLWREQFGDEFIDRAAPDSPAVAYSPGFEPEVGDLAITKDRYSAFRGTDLADQLRRRDIETVIVTGLTTDVCVSSTARDAFQLDFNTITLSDCCAADERARHEAALVTLGKVFGQVCTSDEIIAAWQSRQSEAASAC